MSVDKRLLDALKDMVFVYSNQISHYNYFLGKHIPTVIASAKSAIAKAEAEVDVETRWIEIKAGCEMPTHKQKVDIWIQIGDNPGWRFPYAEWVATSDGPWWCNDDGETIEEAYVYGDDGFHCVTHWMPIPAAPVAVKVEYQGKDK